MSEAEELEETQATTADQKAFLGQVLRKHEVVHVSVPKPDPDNPREHSERNLKVLRNSLDRYGQVVPILLDAKNDMIVSGHGTLLCIKEMGWSHVLVARRTFDSDLERQRLRDIMNRSAELAEWDFELLGKAIKGYQDDEDMSFMGWETYELGPILSGDPKLPPMPHGDGDPPPVSDKPIVVTEEQRETIGRAIRAIRQKESAPEMTEGRCIELISADYLAGAENQ